MVKAKKKASQKKKGQTLQGQGPSSHRPVQPPVDDSDENGVPALEDIDSFPASPPLNAQQAIANGLLPSINPDMTPSQRQAANTNNTFSSAFPHATQQELLATANELYKQIEQAAAAALASTPSTNGATTTRSGSIPLPSGLAPGSNVTSGNNANNPSATAAAAAAHALNLSPEQMHQAAQQLAQVVQSTGWASLGANLNGSLPNGTTQRNQSTPSSNTTTTTIPLGSFTLPLPLHPHPDYPSAGGKHHHHHHHHQHGTATATATVTAQAHSGEFGLVEFTDDEEYESDEPKATSKRKKQKLPNLAQPTPPLNTRPLSQQANKSSLAQQQTIGRPANAPLPTRSAVPVIPQLTPQQHQAQALAQAKKSQPIAQGQMQQMPAAVRPANTATQAAIVREKQQLASLPSSSKAMTSAQTAASKAAHSEREKIRDFWLGLSEIERRALVKIEKESVLRKMKDQQRHGCSCAVCGRKRSAIEEELEVLYDAYYEELEQYAYHQQRYQSSGGTIPPPPGPGPFPGSVDTSLLPSHTSTTAVAKRTQQSLPPKSTGKTTNKTVNAPIVNTANTKNRNHSPSCPHHAHHHGPHVHNGVKCNGHYPDVPQKVAQQPVSVSEDEDDEDDDDDEYDEDDEEEEEEEEEDDDEDGYDDDEYDEEEEQAPEQKMIPTKNSSNPQPVKHAHDTTTNDIFGGGSSLAAKNGGILTVADDLLKNDGQKFLEMMESLADKRIQREREAAEHELMEEESEEEDDDEYEDDEDEEDEDEEDEDDDDDEILTDEQRMEEGRRMFQIFAARMFEQRVLQAYREKVAQERQAQLLRELAEEDLAAAEKDAKKAKDAQKKKDKKKAQREKQDADKLKRDADKKAAEEAAAAAAIKKAEDDRIRALESQRKAEANRKTKELEAMRRDEEKQKRKKLNELQQKEKEEKLKVEREAKEAKLAKEREQKALEKIERERKEAERKEALRLEKEAREASVKKETEERKEAERVKAAAAATLASRQSQVPLSQNRIAAATKTPTLSGRPGPALRPATTSMPGQRPPSAGLNPRPVIPSVGKLNGPISPIAIQQGSKMVSPSLVMQNPLHGMATQRMPGLPSPGTPIRPMQGNVPPVQVPMPIYGRPLASVSLPSPMSPMLNLAGSSNASPSTSRPMGPPGLFGTIGVGQPPVLSKTPSGIPASPFIHSPSSSAGAPVTRTSPSTNAQQVNGVAPIGPPRHPSNPAAAESAASSLAALNLGSQPAQGKALAGEAGAIGVGHGRKMSTDISKTGLKPIGRPKVGGPDLDGLDLDTAPSSTSASLRSPSPPPILGSAALLEEDFEDIPDTDPSTSSFSNVPTAFGGSWGEGGIWGVPGTSSSSSWNEAAPINSTARGPELERADIIRARSGIACLQLNETTGRLHHLAHDVFRVLLASYPDSASVDLQELLQSCSMPANAVNGGGRFSIAQEGGNVMLGFDPRF